MKTITLTRGKISTYDDKTPFLVEDGLLEIEFALPDNTGVYYFVYENGDNRGKVKIIGSRVAVPVKAGIFNCSVKRRNKERNFMEVFEVEPLQIDEVDANLSAFPQISTMQNTLKSLYLSYAEERAALEEKKKSLDGALQEVKENAEKAIHRLAVAFLSFAYAEYKTDIQMNAKDLSAEDFLAAFGFSASDFTEDELNEIKKEKDL